MNSEATIKIYKGKGGKYITKSGEVRQYDQKVKYIPRRKKFDDLLEDKDISEILFGEDKKNMRKIEKVDAVYEIVNSRFKDKKFSREQISNFVYRNC